jgi:hypothetical protein
MTSKHGALVFPQGPLRCERSPSGYCPDEGTMVCHKCGFPRVDWNTGIPILASFPIPAMEPADPPAPAGSKT